MRIERNSDKRTVARTIPANSSSRLTPRRGAPTWRAAAQADYASNTWIERCIEDLHRRRSEERFESLIQNSSDIVMIREEGGVIMRYVSPPIERVPGYRPKDFVGKNNLTFVHPDDAFRVQSFLTDVLNRPGADEPAISRKFRKSLIWGMRGPVPAL